jgi:hypothetical protein
MEQRPKNTTVYYLDQKLLKSRKTSVIVKKQKCQVIELMVKCELCGKTTTKKHFVNGLYVCENCESLSAIDKYSKVIDKFEKDLEKEVYEYVDWDQEDLDKLYYKFWVDE